MAKEKKERILSLEVGVDDAVKSIADLKTNIKLLKRQLEEAEIGTENYQAKLKELKENQNALKDAMYATSASMEDVINSAKGTGETYNSLVHQMAKYKEKLRNIDVSTKEGKDEFDKLAKSINGINDKLKQLDKDQGNHQRNVGNYTSALDGLASQFKSVAGGASNIINPLASVNTGLKVMSTTPVVAILGLLANAISLVVNGLKTSEENINSTSLAMSAFSGVADIFKGVMQTLGKAVSKVAEVLGDLAIRIFPKLREASELRNEITKEEISLSIKQREATQKNADAELEIAKLKAKSVDKEKYSIKERIGFLQEANDLELQIMQRDKEIAEQEYNLALLNAKTAENSKEENDKLAEAYAKKVKAETAYFQKEKELTSQIVAMRKEQSDAVKKKNDEDFKQEQKMLEVSKKLAEARLKNVKENSDEEFMIKTEILEYEYAMEKSKAEKEITNAEEKSKALLEIEERFGQRRNEISREWGDAQVAWRKFEREKELDELEEGSTAYLRKMIELKEAEYLNLMQLDTESDEKFYQRKKKAEEEYLKSKEDLIKHEVQMMQSMANATSGVLSSLADLYESDEKNSKKNAEKIKNLRIASALINTISGALGAYTQASETIPPPYGQIVGALNASAVTATGMAEINKIKSTSLSSSSGSSSSSYSTTAPSVDTSFSNVRSITSASEEDRLNRMASDQKVYILQSDIEASNKASKVKVTESSF